MVTNIYFATKVCEKNLVVSIQNELKYIVKHKTVQFPFNKPA